MVLFLRRVALGAGGALLLMILWLPWAMAQQPAGVGITSPTGLSTVRGAVAIVGSAVHPSFQRYELYYRREPGTDAQWIFISLAGTTPVTNGVLGIWNTSGLADGRYSLRLRVVRKNANYDEYFVRDIAVVNSQSTDTATPQSTPTEAGAPTDVASATAALGQVRDTAVPGVSTATVVVQAGRATAVPTKPAGTPNVINGSSAITSSSTASSESSSILGVDISGLTRNTASITNRDFGSAFLRGIKYTALAFAVLLAFFALKAGLSWLWEQMRG